MVGLLGRRARPLAKLTEKKLSNFLIWEFERKKFPCYYRIEGGERGEDQAFEGEVEVAVEDEQEEGEGDGEEEDGSDEPEVLKMMDTVHPNIRSRAPVIMNYEDQLMIQALETIPTNVLSLKQRRLLDEHGYVEVQEERELIDTSTEDTVAMEEEEREEVKRMLRPEVEDGDAAVDGEVVEEED